MIQNIEIHEQGDLKVSLINYGARIHRLQYRGEDKALFYRDPNDYLSDAYYLNCSIGPIANRIANGCFQVGSQKFVVPRNEGKHALHSGGVGFDKHYWHVMEQSQSHVQFGLRFDLDVFGAHGWVECLANYRVKANQLILDYHATPSIDAYLNLTNHLYMNLDGKPSIRHHRFKLLANEKLLVNDKGIPNGIIESLNTPIEYQLGQQMDNHFNVELDKHSTMNNYLEVTSEESLCRLQISGTSAGYQFYTGSALAEPFLPNQAFCLEPQFAPDAINQNTAYSPITKAGNTFQQRIQWQFSESA